MPASNYEFNYDGRDDALMMWIQEKLDKTYSLNKSKNSTHLLKTFADLQPSEADMYPSRFSIYARDVQAFVHFNLNQATGEITVSYQGRGEKGGNPWWCVAEPRTDSSVCGEGPRKITLLPASDEHGPSIVEYLQSHILRRVPGRSRSRSNTSQRAGARKRRNTRKNRSHH